MTFSKLSFIAAIWLGISGLVSCSVIGAQSEGTLPHTSTSEMCCISDGSDCNESQQDFRLRELRPGDYKGSSLPHIPTPEAECISDK